MLFFLISFNLRDMRRLRTACFVILLSLFLLAVAGVSAYHTGYMSEELVLQQRKDDWTIEAPKVRPPIPAEDKSGAFMWRVRGVGFLNDPNDFAQALIMAMPMLWWFVRKGAWIRNLIFVGLPGALMGYCVTLTNSRGALLGIASLMFFGIRSKLGNFKTMMLMGGGALGAIVIGATGGREFSSKERSAEERIEAWYEGFQMLKSSPLFGVGYGGFTERYYLTAHNSFVLVGYMTCAWFLSRTYQPVLYCLLALCTAVWVCACRSPACANIEPLRAPLVWVKMTFAMVILSIAAVYFFIFMHHVGG
ncbi:MAG: O-antigen ligase family protein [Aquabacterium sp.]|nr:O-antigen ligase family protein [Aquabacterium sp.]